MWNMEKCPVAQAGPDAPPVPSHVPAELVLDSREQAGIIPNDLPDPFVGMSVAFDLNFPRIHYYPWPISGNRHGAWVVTRYEDAERLYTDKDLFSTSGVAEFQKLIGETFRSIPLAIDPPDHGRYRKFLLPWFTPKAADDREPRIRAIIGEMIAEFASGGEVDVAYDFGRKFPVRIFMDLMGFPEHMFESFVAWEYGILHEPELEKKKDALRSVLAYLREFIAEKKASPDDNLGSYIVHGSIDGEPLSDDEVLGMVWFVWLGGIDTVASSVAMMFRRMALDPELQRTLRSNRDLIKSSVDEFLRTQPLVNSGRQVKQDFEWHGVQIKAGDWVSAFVTTSNFDPDRFKDPHQFDPAREGNRHFTFAWGIHVCLAQHLARRELSVMLEEWFDRIPQEFRLKEGTDTTIVPSLLALRNLPIIWDVELAGQG